MQEEKVIDGFDADAIKLVLKEEKLGKFKLQILLWVYDNKYWVYLTDKKVETDLPIECDNPRQAFRTYDSMRRFIKREILKESDDED